MLLQYLLFLIYHEPEHSLQNTNDYYTWIAAFHPNFLPLTQLSIYEKLSEYESFLS